MKNLLVILTLFSTLVGTVNGEPEKEAGKPAANWEYETDDGMFHPERSEGRSNDDPYYKPSLSESAKPSTDDNVKYELPVMSKAEQNAYHNSVAQAERNRALAEASVRRDIYGHILPSAEQIAIGIQEEKEEARRQQEQAMMQQQNALNRARALQRELEQEPVHQAQPRAQQQVRVQQPAQEQAQQGVFDPRTGEYFAPTGNGGYVGTKNGHVMAPAGPDQMIDTKTGRFIQTY